MIHLTQAASAPPSYAAIVGARSEETATVDALVAALVAPLLRSLLLLHCCCYCYCYQQLLLLMIVIPVLILIIAILMLIHRRSGGRPRGARDIKRNVSCIMVFHIIYYTMIYYNVTYIYIYIYTYTYICIYAICNIT